MSFLNFLKDAAKEVSREVTNIVKPPNHKVELKYFKQKHNFTYLSKCPKCGAEGGGRETHVQSLYYIDGKPETYQNGQPIIRWVSRSGNISDYWGGCWCRQTSVFVGKCQHCGRTVAFFKGNLFKQGKEAIKLLSSAVTAINSGFGAARKIGGFVHDVYQSYENAKNSDVPLTESRVGYCSFCNTEHVYCDVCDSTTQITHTPGKMIQDFRCAN
ncbi:hypothetical protein [Fibrobacter succinogenes]|uniref:Uncharacterized protein n=1 Tax=Fibrobacter succinogenes TaxID=833 RepID=A0A380SA25_FIBSU|nr:hypothetical protein [Fibrobacter succinogenes]PWJ33185.1 hypothetical protein IE02_2892 [Fibrobacter succinogenes subsp. elongatus]SUQ26086.1 hypothetical protein SAMN05661053_2892 [Fibrobacter succinogenes]